MLTAGFNVYPPLNPSEAYINSAKEARSIDRHLKISSITGPIGPESMIGKKERDGR